MCVRVSVPHFRSQTFCGQLERKKGYGQNNVQLSLNVGLAVASLAHRWTPCGSVCVWSRKEKDCITGLALVLRNDCSLASSMATGHTDIQRGKPSGTREGFDHVGYNCYDKKAKREQTRLYLRICKEKVIYMRYR